MTPEIRVSLRADVPALAHIAGLTLFPADLLAPMIEPFLAGTQPASAASITSPCLWLTLLHDGSPAGFVYCEAERMADRTWNMLAIAIDPPLQGQGLGARLVATVETSLAASNVRLLLVETSGLPDYALTRRFYETLGYQRVATIPDFYADGEGKCVFVKPLQALNMR
jgi:ribosomal protein S18 acetylase RimI-like enzyme